MGVDSALFSWIIWGFFWEVWSELFQRPGPVCWGNIQQVAIFPHNMLSMESSDHKVHQK